MADVAGKHDQRLVRLCKEQKRCASAQLHSPSSPRPNMAAAAARRAGSGGGKGVLTSQAMLGVYFLGSLWGLRSCAPGR